MAGVSKDKFLSLSENDIDTIIPAACELRKKFINLYGMFKQFPELSSTENSVQNRSPLQNISNILNNNKGNLSALNDSIDEKKTIDLEAKKLYQLDDDALHKFITKDYETFYMQSKYLYFLTLKIICIIKILVVQISYCK